MKIIYDHQLNTKQIMPIAIKAVEQFFVAANNGNTLSPARHNVNVNNGGLAFTIGAETEFSKVVGFRVYDTFPNHKISDNEQIVAVYSTENGKLKAIFIGSKLGAIRTAAINGVAIKYMSDPNSKTATIIGAGYQARYQIAALLAAREIETIYIHNRTPTNAQTLIAALSCQYDVTFLQSKNLKAEIGKSDIIICATGSGQPVMNAKWLKPNTYIGSIGPKLQTRHELPFDIIDHVGLVVSDSIAQIQEYGSQYFLTDTSQIKSLDQLIPAKMTPKSNEISLFLSTGVSGSEVVIGNEIIDSGS